MTWPAAIIGTGFIGHVHASAVRNTGAVVSRVPASSPQRGFDQHHPESIVIGTPHDERVVQRGTPTTTAARFSLLPPGHPQGYQDAFRAFMRDTYAALDGAPPEGLPTFFDGVRTVAICDAVARSAASTSPTWTEVHS